jgi:hypothetical protein
LEVDKTKIRAAVEIRLESNGEFSESEEESRRSSTVLTVRIGKRTALEKRCLNTFFLY